MGRFWNAGEDGDGYWDDDGMDVINPYVLGNQTNPANDIIVYGSKVSEAIYDMEPPISVLTPTQVQGRLAVNRALEPVVATAQAAPSAGAYDFLPPIDPGGGAGTVLPGTRIDPVVEGGTEWWDPVADTGMFLWDPPNWWDAMDNSMDAAGGAAAAAGTKIKDVVGELAAPIGMMGIMVVMMLLERKK